MIGWEPSSLWVRLAAVAEANALGCVELQERATVEFLRTRNFPNQESL
jgi:hypothetical protein